MRCLVLALIPIPALAGSFAPIATLSGTPAIGAATGTTLYGTDPAAGGSGALFSLRNDGTDFAVLHTFNAGTDGNTPNGQLAISPAGTVYGTAQGGGADGGGTVFAYSAGAGFTVPHAFGADGDGTLPLQGPALSAVGTLNGSTAAGAIGTNGNAWAMSPGGGAYTVLHNFLSGSDGHCPFSGVADGRKNAVFGTTVGRGFGGDPNGSVWKITGHGKLATLYTFTDGNDGEWPDEAPALGSNGALYGTTHVQNGNDWAGAIWMLSSAGTFTVLHDLNGTADGFSPNAPLVLGGDGAFYGTTRAGGAGYGTLFRVSKKGAFTVLHSFSGGADGGVPTGALAADGKGFIYGGTSNGVVWRYAP